jgi:hypothetical protein
MRRRQLLEWRAPFFAEAATADDGRQTSRERGLIVQTEEHRF